VTSPGTIAGIEPLSQETFHRFRRLIYETTNINMKESKYILICNRLRKRVLALNFRGYDEYYRYLTEGEGREKELGHFIDAVSTNETYFFREINHFVALRNPILPQLFSRKKRIRVWSAGCSTGEEPYTLRIVIDECRESLGGEAEIIATDISGEVIEKAREGIFKKRSLRFVPDEVLQHYFVPIDGDSYRVCEGLRQGVTFRVHNLLKAEPPEKCFDLIFCRNVMIYFDKDTQRRLVDEHFARALDQHGYLCIGHSESLTGTSSKFRFLKGLTAPIYQKERE
jgi:chemotaxis protein methyltransferase CheR